MKGLLPEDGLLPIDKPVGPTSHDIVAIVRRTLGIRSVGHTGTLDPFASGLLLLCIGRATRLAEYLGGWPKEYVARARLGIRTSTDDLQGEVLSESEGWTGLREAEVAGKLASFLGASEQTPPSYSAKKVEGRAAYARARRGEEVELPAVPIRVHSIELESFGLPWVDFRVVCSTGTYVRALARDLGESLGVGAHLTELRRTAIGPFRVEEALTMEDLEKPEEILRRWIAPLRAVSHLPSIEVTDAEVEQVKKGQPLALGDGRVSENVAGHASGEVAPNPSEVALARGEELVAMARLDGNWVRPRKVFI